MDAPERMGLDEAWSEADTMKKLVGPHGTKEKYDASQLVAANSKSETGESTNLAVETEADRSTFFKMVEPKVAAVCNFFLINADKEKNGLMREFAEFAADKIELSKQCFQFFETEDNAENKRSLFNLAKSALFLNLETFKYGEKNELGSFLAKNPELSKIIEHRWSEAKDFLYDSKKNEIRENYRESIRRMLSKEIESGLFDPNSSLEHLERFLPPMPGSSSTQDSIKLYLNSDQSTIGEYASMGMTDLAKYVLEKIVDVDNANLKDNQALIKIEEELSSIKKKNLEQSGRNVNYVDRQAKLRIVRDLRFARIKPTEMITEKISSEISEDTDYNQILGKNLRQNRGSFDNEVKETIDFLPEQRKNRLTQLLQSYGLPEENLVPVIELIEKYF